MKSKGIRISDEIDNAICVKLPDILEEIQNGNSLHWAILYLDASGHLGEGKSIPVFQKQIKIAEKGFRIEWAELNLLSRKFFEVVDIVLIGCKDETSLHRYDDDQNMYETCDTVIVMLNSCFWEVFSKDATLISQLAKKFKEIKFLEPDFEK